MSTQHAYVARGPFCWAYMTTREEAIEKCAYYAPHPRSIKDGHPIVFDVFEVDAESDIGICDMTGSISVKGGSEQLDLVGAHLHDANGATPEACPECGRDGFNTGEIFLGVPDGGGRIRVSTAYTCGCVVTAIRRTASDAS